eukprot:Clim_evm11s139 gene=Clim_evmTU11s139
MNLVEESLTAERRGKALEALEMAREAHKLEKSLNAQRKSQEMKVIANLDLTYSVMFNLAKQYEVNAMYDEALQSYQAILRNEAFSSDYTAAEIYADLALKHDRYNSLAMVNKGNIKYAQRDFDEARRLYAQAVQNDQSCFEGHYNLGLVYRRLAQLQKARDCFKTAHSLKRTTVEPIYQMACLFDEDGLMDDAKEWYGKALTIVPTDAGLHQRLGDLYEELGDLASACNSYSEAHKYNSTDRAEKWARDNPKVEKETVLLSLGELKKSRRNRQKKRPSTTSIDVNYADPLSGDLEAPSLVQITMSGGTAKDFGETELDDKSLPM